MSSEPVVQRTDGFLLKYVRDENRGRRGIVLAFQPEGCDYAVVSYSLCRADDKFDREEGIRVAKNRVMTNKKIPSIVRHDLTEMTGRAMAYFQSAKEIRTIK